MKLVIETFSSWNFRNLDSEPLSFDPTLNLFLGSNGQGKTNFLEALGLLGSLKSFRGASPKKMVRRGESAFRVEAQIRTSSGSSLLRQIVEIGSVVKRQLFLSGAQISVSEYLQLLPVYVLSGEDVKLVRGLPQFRRALLDRIIFFEHHKHLEELNRYQSLLRQRNAALQSGSSAPEMLLWEERLADSAAAIVLSRLQIFEAWRPRFLDLYQRLRGEDFPEIDIEYRWEFSDSEKSLPGLAEKYRERYYRERNRDRRVGYTIDGPHRHDLQLRVGDRPLRDLFSSGQTRIVAAALSLSGLVEVESRRGEYLPVLADDIDAELDEGVLKNMVNFLGKGRQIFLASAHRDTILELFPTALQFEVRKGRADRGVRND